MDNKITKRRLSDFLAYDWIMMIASILAAIVLWELVYGIVSIKLTPGQQFKIYYDQGTTSNERAVDFLNDNNVLSYDILEVDIEQLISDANVLTTRLSVYEGDIIITDAREIDGAVRAKQVVDTTSIYTLDGMLLDAKNYLKKFLKDGITADGAELDYANLDEQKIRDNFIVRQKGDNRFRKDEQIENGVKLECQRIEKLVKDTKDFEYFLLNAPDEVFFNYTKYEQTVNGDLPEYYDEQYRQIYETELLNRPNAKYGINAGKLTGGEVNPSLYFVLSGETSADGAIIMAFNFLEQQPDLQFECVSYMTAFIRLCSDII